MSKKLLVETEKITKIEYQQERDKGWMFNKKRISIRQLEAYLVYWLWRKKINCKNVILQ